jgi:hypothetical protein
MSMPLPIRSASGLASTSLLVCIASSAFILLGCGGSQPSPKTAQATSNAALADCQPQGLVEPTNPGEPYRLRSKTLLCPGVTYTRPFVAEANDVELDCRGATIRDPTGPEKRKKSATRTIDTGEHSGVVIRNCTLDGGTGILVRGVRATISHVTVRLSSQTGIHFLSTDGLVEDSTIEKSHSSGIYLGFGSARIRVERNTLTDNGQPRREGIAIDSSPMNQIVGNRITGNGQDGITLYRNCGELGTKPRPNEAYGNVIAGNTIAGHSVSMNPSAKGELNAHAWRGTGISVASRQGETLQGMQDFTCRDGVGATCQASPYGMPIPPGTPGPERKLGICNDDSYQRFDWHGVNLNAPSPATAIAEPGGRMHLVREQRVLYRTFEKGQRSLDGQANPFLLDRHYDFAPRTRIENNVIFDNDVGILVADQETEIIGNRFFGPKGPKLKNNRFADLLIGNGFVDRVSSERAAHGLPVLASYVREMKNNSFGSLPKNSGAPCITTSAWARQQVFGTDAAACPTQLYFDYDFARSYAAGDPLLTHAVGRAVSGAWVALAGEGAEGYLVDGPQATDIPTGHRIVDYWVSRQGPAGPGGNAVRLEVLDTTTNKVLVSRAVSEAELSSDPDTSEFTLPFENHTLGHALSFRIWWRGTVGVRVERITVR